MATFVSTVRGWFGWGGRALGAGRGLQHAGPGASLVEDTSALSADTALQLSTVWSCVHRRASTIASLPFFVYAQADGRRSLARTDRLYGLLKDSPNARMTPYEFWVAMMLNHDLRGNAYARIDRAPNGEAMSLWPMPADQVQPLILPDGSLVYQYMIDGNLAVLAAENVLHLKEIGNGTVGFARLDYMRATTTEASRSLAHATRTWANGGKPSGALMIDSVLKPGQREALLERFGEMARGNAARLFLLEANMKYQALTLSPEDIELLDSRKFSVEEICRWFDVPPVLAHHSNVTTWGSGVEQIVDGFHKFTVRPLLVSIEQAVTKRVMTPAQRARLTAEFSLDALLRGNAKDRAEIAAKKVQNGLATRNEMRQLENEPPVAGGDVITVQANLLPIEMLGKVKPTTSLGASDAASQDPVTQ